jgi:hypothetical protein
MARTASTVEAEFALIERAQTWFRLAEEQEQPSANIDFVISVGERPVAQRQQQVQRVAETPLMANNDDPNAPYRLYDGDDRIGTYLTRAEARRAKQKLEDEAGEKQRLCVIKDKHERIVL